MISQTAGRTAVPFSGRLLLAWERVFRAAAPPLFLLWLLCVVASDKPNVEIDVYDATLRLHVLIGAFALAYVAFLALTRRLPGPTPLDWPAAALILAYMASVAASADPRLSAEVALLLGTGLIVFYACHDWSLFSPRALARSLVGVVLLLSLLGLLGAAIQYAGWLHLVAAIKGHVSASDLLPPALPRSKGFLDSANGFAMLLGIVLPLALALAWRPQHRADRLLGAVALSLGLAALFFTQSRGAWLAVIVWLPTFFLLAQDGGGPRVLTAAWRWLRSHVALVGAASVACLVVAALTAVVFWEARPGFLFRATASEHFDSIAVAWRIFRNHPLLGAGPYTYGLLYDAYGGKFPASNIYAHNVYLRVLADAGALGGAVLLAGAAILLEGIRRALFRVSPGERALLAGCVASIVAVMVHGLVEAPSSWNTVLLPFAIVVAIAVRISASALPLPASRASIMGLAPRVAIVGLVPLTLFGWVLLDRPHAEYSASLALIDQGRLADAAGRASAAADADANLAAYQIHAGVTEARLYSDQATTGQADARTLDEAIAYLRRGVDLDPRSGIGHANLALVLQLKGDAAGAAEAAESAFADTPLDPKVAAVAGTVLEANGLDDEAVAAYASAVKVDPGLAQSPFWSETPQRLQLRGRVLAASSVDACRLGRDAALYGVYPDDLAEQLPACRSLVAAAPGNATARAGLSLMLYALGRQDEAASTAAEARRQLPSAPDVRLAAALLLNGGDIETERMGLVRAAAAGSKDAIVLLSYSYAALTPSLGSLLLPASTADDPPQPVLNMLPATLPAGTGSLAEAAQSERLTRNYYRVDFLRQAPDVVILPGDWVSLASPRTLLALDALNASR